MTRSLFALSLLAASLLAGTAHADAIDDLAPGQWYRIPDSKLRAVCPPDSASYEWSYYCQGATAPWSGATLDTTRGRLMVWGGGHGDYKGNEVYTFDFGTLSWARPWGPTPDAQIPSGGTHEVYDDGNPGSRHTYSGLTYVPAPVDAMISMGGALWQSGSFSVGTWSFSVEKNSWTRLVDGPAEQGFGDPCVYDPVTKHIFRRANSRMFEFDPVASAYTQRADSNGGFWASNVAAALDPEARLMVIVGGERVDLYHLDTDTYEQGIALTGASAKDLFGGASPGIDFDPIQKKFVLWSGGLDVYTFDPVARAFSKHPASGDDPGPSTMSGGVFGRFRYIPSRNVFARVNSVDDDVFVFRMAPGAGTPVGAGGSGGAGGEAGAAGQAGVAGAPAAGSGGSAGAVAGQGGAGQGGAGNGGAGQGGAGQGGAGNGGAGASGASGQSRGGQGGAGASGADSGEAASDDGCGCRSVGGRAAPGAWGPALALALALRLRRRSRR